jgi:hypothetical protein
LYGKIPKEKDAMTEDESYINIQCSLTIGGVKKKKRKLVKMVLIRALQVLSPHLMVIQLCKAQSDEMA